MTETKSMNRVVFLLRNFRQGSGGVPESVRLMAQALLEHGYASDVIVSGRIFKGVGKYPCLPKSHDEAEPIAAENADYSHAIMVGPWQSPLGALRVLFRNVNSTRLIYVPKGGISKIEFSRLRDIKKLPYLFLIEAFWLLAARHIVFSSKLEMDSTFGPISLLHHKCTVIPDLFLPSWPRARRKYECVPGAKIKCSFLAEIHPRKGLEELIHGFHDWVVQHKLESKVVLKVGGVPRPGSEVYFDRILKFVESTPLRQCVQFVGPVAHEDRCDFYSDTDVFLATSQFESYCLTVLEALHSGCLVLAGPDIGVLEYVSDHPNLLKLTDLSSVAINGSLQQIEQRVSKLRDLNRAGASPKEVDVDGVVNSIALNRWQKVLAL